MRSPVDEHRTRSQRVEECWLTNSLAWILVVVRLQLHSLKDHEASLFQKINTPPLTAATAPTIWTRR